MISIYLELAKARLTALVVMTAGVGYVVAANGPFSWGRLFWTVFGTALAAGGANALNQVIEIERDRLMERTRRRALPDGRIGRGHALIFASIVSAAGPVLLALFVNGRTASLGLAAIVLYVLVYTPMKPLTPLCTLVGAVCGAIPPVMGWTARTGELGAGGWILGALLFVWQIPHFLALAWLYREDYARGGFRMLPSLDVKGIVTFRMILLYSLVLLPIGLALTLTGSAGPIYAAGSLLFGGALLVPGVKLYRRKGDPEARRLFFATLLYMPLVLGLMVIDRGPGGGIPVAALAEAVSSWEFGDSIPDSEGALPPR
ncbi:MAG: heme o synthase [Candidatus Eisenbacteria bacterium]